MSINICRVKDAFERHCWKIIKIITNISKLVFKFHIRNFRRKRYWRNSCYIDYQKQINVFFQSSERFVEAASAGRSTVIIFCYRKPWSILCSLISLFHWLKQWYFPCESIYWQNCLHILNPARPTYISSYIFSW